jgi:hypothetical protein
MQHAHAVVVVTVATACGATTPRYDTTQPVTPKAAPPVAPGKVALHLRPLPWWTAIPAGDWFPLGLPTSERAPPRGAVVGDLRSIDVELDESSYQALRCAWLFAPGGKRGCGGERRTAAIDATVPMVSDVLQSLRERAGEVGATGVRDVRCFADARGEGRLWCEGTAVRDAAADVTVTSAPGARRTPSDDGLIAVAPLPAPSPTEAFDDATAGGALDVLRPGKLSVHGAFTASMRGGDPVLGQDIGLRYGALGTAIRVLKFGGDSQVMGVGLVAELQHRPSRSPVELLVGGSAMVAAPNGATNPAFEGLLGAHVGATKQLTYRIRGVAQPYISLRAGALRTSKAPTDGGSKVAPMVELHLGLSTPRR